MLRSKEHLRRRPQKIWLKSENRRIASTRSKERQLSENNFEFLFKCVRIIFCIGCFLGFTFHVSKFLHVYFQYPTRLEFSVTFNEELSAPAISIANHNRLRKSALCKLYDCISFSEEMKGFFKLKKVMRLVDEMMLNLDGTFLMSSGHQLKNMIEQPGGHGRRDGKNKEDRDGNLGKKRGSENEHGTDNPGNNRSHSGNDSAAVTLIPLNTNFWKGHKKSDRTKLEKRWKSIHKRMNECSRTARRFSSVEHGNIYTLSTNDTFEITDNYVYSFLVNVESKEYFEPLPHKSLKLELHDPATLPIFGADAIEIEPGNFVKFKKIQKNLLPSPFSSRCARYETADTITKNQSLLYSSSSMCKMEITSKLSLKVCNCYLLTRTAFLSDTETRKKCKIPENILDLCDNKTVEARKGININNLCPQECSDLAHLRIIFIDHNLEVLSLTPQYQSMELFSFIGGYMGIWLGLSFLQLPAYSLSFYSWYQRKRRFRPVQSRLRHRAPAFVIRID